MACLIAAGVAMLIDYGIQVGMNYANGYRGADAWFDKVDMGIISDIFSFKSYRLQIYD